MKPTAPGGAPSAEATLGDGFQVGNINDVYRIGAEIGKGHFGTCFKVTHRRTNKEYACKIVPKIDLKNVEDLKREARTMMQLHHNNVVRFHELYEDKSSIYIVQELCEGGDLFSHIERLRRYTETDAAYLARQLLAAVKHCHKRGIIHRDIKPDNILVCGAESRPVGSDPTKRKTPTAAASPGSAAAASPGAAAAAGGVAAAAAPAAGAPPLIAAGSASPSAQLGRSVSTPGLEWFPGTVKLCDFGLATKVVTTQFQRDTAGTFMYMAPEVIESQKRDASGRFVADGYSTAADMWSVGCVLYGLVHGYVPFQPMGDVWQRRSDSDRRDESIRLIRRGFHPVVLGHGAFGPNFTASIPIAEDCRNLIGRLLDKDPARRPTAEEALHSPWLQTESIRECAIDLATLSSLRKWNARSALKQMLVRGLSWNEVRCGRFNVDVGEITRRFKSLDLDGDGYVTADELLEVTRRVAKTIVLPLENGPTESKNGSEEAEAPGEKGTFRARSEAMGARTGAVLLSSFFAGGGDTAVSAARRDGQGGENNTGTNSGGMKGLSVEELWPKTKRRRVNVEELPAMDVDVPTDLQPPLPAQGTTNADGSVAGGALSEEQEMRHKLGRMLSAESYGMEDEPPKKSEMRRKRRRESSTPANGDTGGGSVAGGGRDVMSDDDGDEDEDDNDLVAGLAAEGLSLSVPMNGSETKENPAVRRQLSAGSEAVRESIEDMVGWTGEATIDDIRQVIKNLDLDGDGRLSLHEVTHAFYHAFLLAKEERMRLLFRLLDLDKSGKLSSDTIKKVFNQLGFQSSAAIDEAFAEIANPDGRIDYNRFLEMLEFDEEYFLTVSLKKNLTLK